MMATVHHVTSSSGLRKFQTDGFLFVGVYNEYVVENIVILPNITVIVHLWLFNLTVVWLYVAGAEPV